MILDRYFNNLLTTTSLTRPSIYSNLSKRQNLLKFSIYLLQLFPQSISQLFFFPYNSHAPQISIVILSP